MTLLDTVHGAPMRQVRTPEHPNYDLTPEVNQQAITVSAPDRRADDPCRITRARVIRRTRDKPTTHSVTHSSLLQQSRLFANAAASKSAAAVH